MPIEPSASKPTTTGHPTSKTKSYAPARPPSTKDDGPSAAAKPTVPRSPSTKDDGPPAAAKPTVPRSPSTKDDVAPAAAKPQTAGHPASKTTGYGSSKAKDLDTPVVPSLTDRFGTQVEPPRDYLPPPPPPPPLTPAEQATVDAAVAEVNRAAYDDDKIQPGAGTAALLEQISANPDLADDIAAASGDTITDITESLNDSDLPPEDVRDAVEQLATAEELTDNGAVAEAVAEGIPAGGASSTFIGALASTPFGQKLANKTPLKQQVSQVAAVLPNITGTADPVKGAQALQDGAASLPPHLVDALLVASTDAVNQLTSQLPQHDANEQADVALALLETAELGTGARTDVLANALLQDGVLGEAAIIELAAGDMEGKSRLVNAIDDQALQDGHPQAEAIHAARVARENTDGILQRVQDGDITGAADLLQLVSTTSPPDIAAFVLEDVLDEGGIQAILNGVPGLEPEQQGGIVISLSETVSMIGSDDLTGRVAELVADQIPQDAWLGPDQLYYDGFELAIANGYGAALGGRVVEVLVARGDTNNANAVLEAVNTGVSLLTSDIDYQADRIDQLNGDLFYLDMQFGGLKSEEDRARAAAEYVASFPDYEWIGPYGAAAVRDQKALDRLDGLDLELDAAYDIEDRRADLLEQTSRPAVMQNDQARAALGQAIVGQEPWVSDVRGLLQEFGDEGLQAAEFFATSSVRAATEMAAQAAAGGDLAKARSVFEGLGEQSALLDLSPKDLKAITGTLNDITAASAAQNLEEVARLQEELDRKVPKGKLGTFLSFGGVALAGAGFVGSVADLLDDPSLGNIFDTTLAGGELAGAFGEATVKWLPKTGELLAKAGNVANFINIGFDTLGAVGSALEGDYAAAGLQFAGALGSTAVAVGTSSLTAGALAASLTGFGAVLVVGSAIGLAQYAKVQLSNEHENPITEAYIRVGLEDVSNPNLDQVIFHLRDADDEGRGVGILFGQAATKLKMSGEEFMRMIAELPPDQVLDLVHKAHGIDPEDSNDPRSLPQTHDWDEWAGTRQSGTTLGQTGRGAMSEVYVDPKSVEGWIQYLRVTGVLPPA